MTTAPDQLLNYGPTRFITATFFDRLGSQSLGMLSFATYIAVLGAALITVTRAQYDASLVGTWSTKSKAVSTGPGFYDPVKDRLIEPALTGISYSFTIDGYYEEAYYRAVSNPTVPQCPSGVMQWQHGTYSLPGNGSLVLQPFAVDGRQLTSTPCTYGESVYERYDQPELIKSYQVLTDPYHNVPRLNLYKFDGSPMNPMFLLASPPQMLPTQTLNPTSTAAPAATAKSRIKRAAEPAQHPFKPKHPVIQKPSEPFNADKWWWVGIGSIALGTVMYMMPTSA